MFAKSTDEMIMNNHVELAQSCIDQQQNERVWLRSGTKTTIGPNGIKKVSTWYSMNRARYNELVEAGKL